MQTPEASFQGRMLRVARQARGLTQAQVAKSTGITQAFVHMLEDGDRGPSDEQLEKISEALKFPKEFFCQPDLVVGPGVGELFHRRRRMSPKSLDRFYAWANIKIMAVRRLLEVIEWPDVNLPILSLDIDVASPEDAAAAVRARWHIPTGPVRNISAYLDAAGVLVIAEHFDDPEMDGMSVMVADLPPMIFVNRSMTQDRLRFTLMHEVGHLVLHQRSALREVSDSIEREAHDFASAFLMPADQIKPKLRELKFSDLAPLKRSWGVSMSAVVMRARETGTISPSRATELWREISRRGWMKREPEQFDISGEVVGVLYEELIELHLSQLEHTPQSLSGLINLNLEDTRQRIIPPSQRHSLYVVTR